jgi:Fic family protein/DNA-binding Xre family transcriptional regulator
MIISEAKLKEVLKERGLKKSTLCDGAGVSSRTIAKISKGENINDKVVKKISDFLGVDSCCIVIENVILKRLREEMEGNVSGGLYHETQIKLTYNSNHMEGSKLSEEQTRYIFETETIGLLPSDVHIDDVIETHNHFRCVDYVIENASEELSEEFILTLQRYLKDGTEHAKKYGAGSYKSFPNVVGGMETVEPCEVKNEMKKLIAWYNSIKRVTFEDIVEFHYRFETIHPFQDGNGRIGRLIAFKQCLNNNFIPFYIDDRNKWFYYRGLREWKEERNFLIETCRFGQDQYKRLLNYFNVVSEA